MQLSQDVHNFTFKITEKNKESIKKFINEKNFNEEIKKEIIDDMKYVQKDEDFC